MLDFSKPCSFHIFKIRNWIISRSKTSRTCKLKLISKFHWTVWFPILFERAFQFPHWEFWFELISKSYFTTLEYYFCLEWKTRASGRGSLPNSDGSELLHSRLLQKLELSQHSAFDLYSFVVLFAKTLSLTGLSGNFRVVTALSLPVCTCNWICTLLEKIYILKVKSVWNSI